MVTRSKELDEFYRIQNFLELSFRGLLADGAVISFITLTFPKGLSVGELVAFLRSFFEKLKREKGSTTLTYFYGFELHKDRESLHIHLVVDLVYDSNLERRLISYWNKKNKWKWFNERGLVIKKVESKECVHYVESLAVVLGYILKSLSVEPFVDYLVLHYLFGKKFCFSASSNLRDPLKALAKNVRLRMDLAFNVAFSPVVLATGLHGGVTYSPKDKTMTVRSLLAKFLGPSLVEKDYPKLYKILELIDKGSKLKDAELFSLQQQVEFFIYEENYGRALDIERLYKVYDPRVKAIFEALLCKINMLLSAGAFAVGFKNDYLETLRLVFTTERLVVILLETLIVFLRPLKKDVFSVSGLQEPFTFEGGPAVTVAQAFLLSRLFYTLKYNLNSLLLSKDFISTPLKATLESLLLKKNITETNKNLILKLLFSGEDSGECAPDAQVTELDDHIFLSLSFLIIEAAQGVSLLVEKTVTPVIKAKSYKTVINYEINSVVLHHFINELALLHIQLPFVVPPKDFVMVQPGVYKGGYHIDILNEKYNIFVTEKYVLKPFIEKSTLDYINKWQKQSYAIDEKYLDYILDLTLWEVYSLTDNTLSLDVLLAPNKRRRSSFDAAVLAKQFLITLYIADKFKGYKNLWFLWKMDARLRVYSVGSPLNFQGSKLLRYLFQLSEDSPLAAPVAASAGLFFDYVRQRKEVYYKKYLLMNPLHSWIQLDAKAQSFQIIGGLLGERKLLELVFVLRGKGEQDIYAYYAEKLKDAFSEGPLASALQEAIVDYAASRPSRGSTSNYSDYLAPEESKPYKLKDFVFTTIISRDFVKRILMFTSYNKSLKETIADELKLFFKDSKPYRGLYQVMSLLVKQVISLLNVDFPKLSMLKRMFTNLASMGVLLKQGIFMSLNAKGASNSLAAKRSFLQNYPLMKSYKVQRWVPMQVENSKDKETSTKVKRGKNITVYFYDLVKDEQGHVVLDLKKNQNALLPNSMHHIDAEILYLTVSKLLSKGVPILAIHDAFYTAFGQVDVVKNCYVESYGAIMEKKPLLCYIRNSFSYWCLNSNSFNMLLSKMAFKEQSNGKLYCDSLTIKKKVSLSKEDRKLWGHIRVIVSCYNAIVEGSLQGEALAQELGIQYNSKILS